MGNATPWMYQNEPGNARLTQVVDLRAFRVTAASKRIWVRFNRSIGSATTSRVWVWYGFLTEPEFVQGSRKMGVALERPNWTFNSNGIIRTITGTDCSGFARTSLLNQADPTFDMLAVIVYQPGGINPPAPRVVSPPFTWRRVLNDVPGTLCY